MPLFVLYILCRCRMCVTTSSLHVVFCRCTAGGAVFCIKGFRISAAACWQHQHKSKISQLHIYDPDMEDIYGY